MTWAKRLFEKYKSMSLPARAAFWYAVCNVLNKGLALLATPIFTRILTEAEYGEFAIFQSWVSILMIITSLNVFLGGYKKGLLLFKEDVDGFTTSQLGLTTTLTIVAALVYCAFPSFWSGIFEIRSYLMLAMFMELLMMPAYELWMARQQFEYNYQKAVFVSITMSVLGLGIAIVAVVGLQDRLAARVYSDAIVKMLFAGSLFVLIFCRNRKFYSRKYWGYALSFNLPLIPHYLSNYVLNQSDRLMIGRMVGAEQAAFYSVAYTIATMMLLITSAIANAITPYIYKSIEGKNADVIKEKLSPIILLVAGLTVVTTALSPEIVRVFAGENYLDAIYAIPPISAAVFFIFVYSLYSTIEYYYQKTKKIAVATSFAAIMNILLNFIGIRMFGYIAAGYTTLICYVCLAVFHYVFYKQIIRKELPGIHEVYDLRIVLVSTALVVSSMLVMTMVYHLSVVRYTIILIVLVLLIVNRKKLGDAIKKS